jgi:hypothetical protein
MNQKVQPKRKKKENLDGKGNGKNRKGELR